MHFIKHTHTHTHTHTHLQHILLFHLYHTQTHTHPHILTITHTYTLNHTNTHTHTHTHTHSHTHAHTSAIMADTLLFHGGCFPPCFPSAVCLIKADLRGPQRFLCLCVLKGSFQRLPSTAQSN